MPKPSLDIDEIRSLAEQGLTDNEIAKKLGCHLTSVGNARRRHGIEPSRPKASKINPFEVFKLKARGYTDREVAVKLGCTRQGVWQVRREYGFLMDGSAPTSTNNDKDGPCNDN